MALLAPSPKNVEAMHREFSVDRQSIQEAVDKLKQWLSRQPHLPSLDDDRRLERVLATSKFSLPRAQQSLDRYFSLRNHLPELLRDRDPLSPSLQRCLDIMSFVPLPRPTAQGLRVTLCRLEPGPGPGPGPVAAGALDPLLLCKAALMVSEVRLAEDSSLGDVLVFDLHGASLAHLLRFTVPLLRKLELCVTGAFNVRVSALHYVNAPNFVDKLLAVLRTALKPKVAARIHVHTREAGVESLHAHVPPTLLPAEYGGVAGSLQDLRAAWRSKLDSYRDWFLEQEAVSTDESRRPGRPVRGSDLLGFEGSFRQLSVD